MKVLDFKQSEIISYLISFDEKQLVLSDYVEFMANPYAREEAIEVEDITEEFRKILQV